MLLYCSASSHEHLQDEKARVDGARALVVVDKLVLLVEVIECLTVVVVVEQRGRNCLE